jgi:hypothetical protein
MRTPLLIATAAAAALLAGAVSAQPAGASGSNFSQNPPSQDTAVNPPSDKLPAGVATGNATTNQGPSGQAGSSDSTAPSASASDTATVAPAAGAPTERAPTATAGSDLVSNGPVPDTRENRQKYGRPLSNAGRMTKAAGN